MQAAPPAEIRHPWPDELPRLRHFLPEAYLFDEPSALFVGVRGPAERLVAAESLAVRTTPEARVGVLHLRAEPGETQVARVAVLARHALGHARDLGLDAVRTGQTFSEDSVPAQALAASGFAAESVSEVYAFDARPTWERLRRIHERLRERGLLPTDARLSTLQPQLYAPVRDFVLAHLPVRAARFDAGTSGYRPDHSLVLLVRGEVKGVIFCRRSGRWAYIGLRLVAPELRGGIGWANLLLLHASLGAALQSGLVESRFEFNPLLHGDTVQMAQFHGARPVGRRIAFAAALEKV